MPTREDATLNGVRPRAGMRLINAEKRLDYGEIVSVRADGAVRWRPNGDKYSVETQCARLYDCGYSYADKTPRGFKKKPGPVSAPLPVRR